MTFPLLLGAGACCASEAISRSISVVIPVLTSNQEEAFAPNATFGAIYADAILPFDSDPAQADGLPIQDLPIIA